MSINLSVNLDNLAWVDSVQELIKNKAINLSVTAQSIISHSGSSTKLLKSLVYPNKVDLILLSQNWHEAEVQELNRLGLINNIITQVFERSIVMSVNNQHWIYARSYFNKQACDDLKLNLINDVINLGDKFLGELLLTKYPEIIRSSFEYNILSQKDNSLIIRRSVYKLNNIILFNLDEIFLPELINYFK